MERLAIITISIGNRPWSNYTIPSMEHYAGVCGADFFVERFPPLREELPLPELAPSPGRRNKIAYAAKSFFPWKYIEIYGYDRVLVLDDTCCIRRNAESIFDLVPRGYCGIKKTSPRHAQVSFRFIDSLVKAGMLKEVAYNEDYYMNSGVILYDRICVEAIRPEKIVYAAQLLYSRYPHQTLAYYLFMLGNVPLFFYPDQFNCLPARRLPLDQRANIEDVRPYLEDDVRIYHVTGKYKHRNLIVRQICDYFLHEV